MKNVKKIISILLALTLCYSLSISVFAAGEPVDSVGSVIGDINKTEAEEMTGQDSNQYASSLYHDFNTVGDQDVEVFVTKASTYTVTIPKTIILDGSLQVGHYTIRVVGDLSGTEYISVIPYTTDELNLLEDNNSFKLSQSGKNDIAATVMQEKTEWRYSDLSDGNGTITVSNLSAGSWTGSFVFNISRRESTYPVRLIEGDGQTVNKFAFNEMRFRSSAPANEFTEVRVNGEIVDPSYYTVSEGSTVIVFNNNYVDSLEVKANQTIEIVSDSGIADGDFNVVNLIPSGGSYTTADGTVYGSGTSFPATVNPSDTYTYGDYQYRYGYTWCAKTGHDNWSNVCGCNFTVNHWAVHVIDNTKTSYQDPLTQINGDYISDLTQTYAGCHNLLASPNIPNGIESLKGAYADCYSLIVAPVIPNSVTNVEGTFENCKSLKKAPAIPAHITNMNYTFNYCESLEKAPVIPSNVSSMQDTFAYCKSLKEAPAIPSSVMMMVRTFKGCSSLTKTPEFGEGVKYLMWTFQDCTSLTDITLPVAVINLQETFKGCSSLKTLPEFPSTIFSMSFTFAECTSLKDLGNAVLPNTSLYGLFANCTSLVTAPVIPSGATNISKLFEGCTALSGNITINSNASTYSDCFKGVDFSTQNITLLGDSTILDTLGATGSSYCTTCNGVCAGNH